MDIKLLFVFFLFGVIMKLYDDLNDNNLFEYFNILKEKDYINHFLIGVFYICGTIHAFKESVLFLGNTLFFVINMFYDKKAFDQPHEFTCLIFSILLTLYLLFFENLIGNTFDEFKKMYLILCDKDKYIYLIVYCIIINIIYYCEYSLLNNEYSYKKLIVRFFILTTFIILFVITKSILPNIFIFLFLCNIGYYITSCIFQIILIRKDIIEKSLKKEKNKKRKRKNKKEKKE
jgi:hypothetical protein